MLSIGASAAGREPCSLLDDREASPVSCSRSARPSPAEGEGFTSFWFRRLSFCCPSGRLRRRAGKGDAFPWELEANIRPSCSPISACDVPIKRLAKRQIGEKSMTRQVFVLGACPRLIVMAAYA